MTLEPLGELHELETADGNKLVLPGGNTAFLSYGGYGAPPIQYITRRGYRQHGVTEIDYLLESRPVSVTLYQDAACTRQEYWDNRYALQEFLRPNRGGPITFTLRQPNGDLRSLLVRPNPGMVFNPPTDNSWNINEPIEFIAFDPVWFDPATAAIEPVASNDENLVFPITFPIIFGTAGLFFSSGSFIYPGSWRSYPTLVLTGPYQTARLSHVEFGATIDLTVPISAGHTRTIVLTPGSQSVVDQDGVSRFGELGPNANLIDFFIAPEPEAVGGVNTITAQLFGGAGGTSAFRIDYQTRYFAL